MANFLGITRQVPTCLLNANQPAQRAAAPHPQPAVRTCQHARGRSHQRQEALHTWILHAVRADQQGSQVDSSTLQLISDLTNKVDKEHASILAENAQGLEGIVEDAASDSLKGKVQQSIQKLQKGLLERETEVRSFCLHTWLERPSTSALHDDILMRLLQGSVLLADSTICA